MEFTSDFLKCEPILREDETKLDVKVKSVSAEYDIHITKPEGFRRVQDGVKITADGNPVEGTGIPVFTDGQAHEINVVFD